MKVAVIFGGTGFIGSYYTQHLLENNGFDKVYIYDMEGIKTKTSMFRRKMLLNLDGVDEIIGDIRRPIDWVPAEKISLVANFAAIHREPGHTDSEYYETNLLGAENVCEWSERVGCKTIIFSSSISPYGSSEDERDESSTPVPNTAYGCSKLLAEKIHEMWEARGKQNRLIIVRPGVVFGPGEGGNVSRLIKAVRNRFFFYAGNQSVRKAGIYVKELCFAISWVLERERDNSDNKTLVNMTMNPGPSIGEYVCTAAEVLRMNVWVPTVPYKILLVTAVAIETASKMFGFHTAVNSVRVRKLIKPNNILPNYLVQHGYEYKYSLRHAFEDWKKECPSDWE